MAAPTLRDQESKQLGTVETLRVILEHRKILSECIKEMDKERVNFIPESTIFSHLAIYTQHIKADLRRRLRIAFSRDNLLQAHIVMDVDNSQGQSRLYFQSSVIDIVRLCDVSLFKKLTDVQLKSHLSFLNLAHQKMVSGELSFSDKDDDFIEFIDNLFMHIGQVLSDIRQNVIKMQSMGKELESLTASSVNSDIDTAAYIQAKHTWLNEIVKLYERHILPVLLFLNPETTYEEGDGLHAILSKITTTLNANQQTALANNCEAYTLSLLNFYQPIESTANSVNRFIHKERDSIKRFNALEHFYQHILLPELRQTQSDNLNKKLIGDSAIMLRSFSPYIKAFARPMGYAFSTSTAYYKNLLNELEARSRDALELVDLSGVFAAASNNQQAEERMRRYQALMTMLEQVTMRETEDLIGMLHQRLREEFDEYALHDLIACSHALSQKRKDFVFSVTNRFSLAEHENNVYRYRKIRCIERGSAIDDRQNMDTQP